MQRHESEPQSQGEPKGASSELEGPKKIRLEFELPQVPKVPITRRELFKYGLVGLGGAAVGLVAAKTIGSFPSTDVAIVPPKPLSPSERASIPEVVAQEIEKGRTPSQTRTQPQEAQKAKERIKELWKAEVILPGVPMSGKVPDWLLMSGGRVFFIGGDGFPVAYILGDSKPLWKAKSEGVLYGTDPQGTLLYTIRTAPDKRLYIWDVNTGNEFAPSVVFNPAFSLPEDLSIDWPLRVTDKYLIIPFYALTRIAVRNSGDQFFIREVTGELGWDHLPGKPIFHTNKTVLSHQSSSSAWIGFDIETGQGKYTIDARYFRNSVQLNDRVVLLDSQGSGNLKVIDIDSGKEFWSVNIGTFATRGEIVETMAGKVFIRDQIDRDKFFAVDILSKETSGPASLGREAFLKQKDGFMFSYNSQMGTIGWHDVKTGQDKLKDDIRVSHFIGVKDGMIIAARLEPRRDGIIPARYDTTVYVLDAKTGELKKGWPVKTQSWGYEPIIVGDSVAVPASQSVEIYKLGTAEKIGSVNRTKSSVGSRLVAKDNILLFLEGWIPSSMGSKPEKGLITAVQV